MATRKTQPALSVEEGFFLADDERNRGISQGLYVPASFDDASHYRNFIQENIQFGTGGAIYMSDIVPGGTYGFGNGTVTRPSITFQNELDTGRYLIASGQIGESIDGVNVGTWSSSGLALAPLTAGRVVYTGTSGLLSVDAGLAYDATNDKLTITGTAGTQLVLAYDATKTAELHVDTSENLNIKVDGTSYLVISSVGDVTCTASRSGADHEFLWKNSSGTASSNSYIIIEQDSGYGAIQFLDTTSGTRFSLGQDSVTVADGALFRLAKSDGLGTNVIFQTTGDGETIFTGLGTDRDTPFFTLNGHGCAFTSAVEHIAVRFNFSTQQAFPGDGSPTVSEQREWYVDAPVYILGSGTAVTFTNAATFYIAGAPSGGAGITISNAWSIWVDTGACRFDGKTLHGGEVEIDGALNHDGTTVGFYGVTPVTRPSAYSITNGTTDRTYDADATSTNELADILYTVIQDLIAVGILQ